MNFHYPFALVVLAVAMPAHAEQAVQELEYRSAFEGYQGYSDPEMKNWPSANQLVDQIGGWRVYAREPYEDKNQDKANEQDNSNAHNHGEAR